MQIGRVRGCTRIIGKSQGYMGLPLRDELINCSVNGIGTPSMVTAWLPTPKEILAQGAGAPVHVRILGSAHPPIMVEVGEPPNDEAPDERFKRGLSLLRQAIIDNTPGDMFWIRDILLAELEKETGFKGDSQS